VTIAVPMRPAGAAGGRETRMASRRVKVAYAVSVTGSEAQDFTMLLLTTAAYGAVLSVGWLGFSMTIGALLLGPALAALQDRRPSARGVLMRRIDTARAALTVLISVILLIDSGLVVVIYSTVLTLTVLEVTFQAALRSSLPLLVRDEQDETVAITKLNSNLMSQWALVQVLVPPILAVLMTVAEPWMVVLFNAFTFAMSSALLRRYAAHITACYEDGEELPDQAGPQTFSGAVSNFWIDAHDGFRVVAADRPVAAMLVSYSLLNAIVFAVVLSIPTLLANGDGVHELATGLAFASLSFGALVGARLSARERLAHRPFSVISAVPFLRALALIAVALIGARLIVAMPLFVLGVSIGLGSVARLSFVQGRFADEMMGRVMSLYAVANQLLMPVAALGGTFAIRWVGLSESYALFGAIVALTGLGLVAVTRRNQLDYPVDKSTSSQGASS